MTPAEGLIGAILVTLLVLTAVGGCLYGSLWDPDREKRDSRNKPG